MFQVTNPLGCKTAASAIEPTMSSQDISVLTNKRHPDVKRDIVRMFDELGIDVSTFAHIYLDGSNRKQTEYLLPRRECEILITGYDVKRRAKVIDRWMELEATPTVISLPDGFICGDPSLLVEYAACAISAHPSMVKVRGVGEVRKVSEGFAHKRFVLSGLGSASNKVAGWLLDFEDANYNKVIMVTNADNPNIPSIKKHVERMISLFGGTIRVCFMTDLESLPLLECKKQLLLEHK